MCVVSMVSDHYRDQWEQKPWWDQTPVQPWPLPGVPVVPGIPPVNLPPTTIITNPISPAITREEFEELRMQVLEMKELLKRAKAYDEANNEPDCEMDEKVVLLTKIAELVGVDLSEIFGKK